LPKFTTEYRDRRTGVPCFSQIEASSTEDARDVALRRGLGERLTSRGPDCVDRARTAEASARLEGFLKVQSIETGLDALDALAHLAHLASVADKELDGIALLSDTGLFQHMLRVVRGVLAGDADPHWPTALLEQLRMLEARIEGLPKESLAAVLPVDRRNPADEVRRLTALLLQAIFYLESLALQPARPEQDRQAHHDRAQALRWGLSKESSET
jgi:hypothetical protein